MTALGHDSGIFEIVFHREKIEKEQRAVDGKYCILERILTSEERERGEERRLGPSCN